MRESYGPEFDNRLIRLVRDNPAIYDVNHEHYRRYQVRVAIWERIAAELRTPSKFLQTKWKNIRYNYLQELKSLETGLANANIRKRRFTEDLSFLQNTAQTYRKGMHMNSYNSSDNDSNSYLYTDQQHASTYEIIEIEHSDEDTAAMEYDARNYNVDVTMQAPQMQEHKNLSSMANNEHFDNDQIVAQQTTPVKLEKSIRTLPDVTIEQKVKLIPPQKAFVTPENSSSNTQTLMAPPSPMQSNASSPFSPMLTPIVVMGEDQKFAADGEITLKSISKQTATAPTKRQQSGIADADKTTTPNEIVSNATKRKSMPAPFPVLTPINDPIELYCLSLVDSLRNMPRAERERVKYEFAKILKDAKYKDES